MSSKNAQLAWLEAENKLDFELRKEDQDEAAIKLAEVNVTKLRKLYMEAMESEQEAPAPLIETATLNNYFDAARKGHPLTGAELELNQELEIESLAQEVRIPFAMFMEQETDRLEFADAITKLKGKSGTAYADKNVMPIIERIFPRAIASRAGINATVISTGTHTVRWTSSTLSADWVAEQTARDAVAYDLTPSETDMTRLTGTVIVSNESFQTVGGLRSVVLNDLRGTIGAAWDNEIIRGDGATPTRGAGILNQIGTSNRTVIHGADVGKATRYQDFLAMWASMPDQHWFYRGENDMRLVIGNATGIQMNSVYNQNSDRERTAYDFIRERGVQIIEGSNAQIPVTAKDSTNGARQQAFVIGSRGLGNVFAPVWNSVGIIADQYGDNARQGTVSFTADMYAGLNYAHKTGTGATAAVAGIKSYIFTNSDKS